MRIKLENVRFDIDLLLRRFDRRFLSFLGGDLFFGTIEIQLGGSLLRLDGSFWGIGPISRCLEKIQMRRTLPVVHMYTSLI